MGFGSDMDDRDEDQGMTKGSAMWRALRPAVPAVIGGAALTFLFAALMPMAWVAAISWNLYLDRVSDLFVPPVGNGARLALALGMAAIAALIAGFVALVIAQPEAAGLGSMRRCRARAVEAIDEDETLPRRRADFHPDAPPRPPIRAGRDLPAEGLGPIAPAVIEDEGEFNLSFADVIEYEEDELVLADPAPAVEMSGDEPWLQPAELVGQAMPDPADRSLGAMVQRFEAGLARRRQDQVVAAAIPMPTASAANEDRDPEVDFALEAALGTLQRLNRQSAG